MNNNLSSQIKQRYEQVLEKIEKAALIAGRKPDSVVLIVVSKTHSLETIVSALDVGICNLGENYVEEAIAKIDTIGLVKGLSWHMIGHIQSRKAELVVQKFDYVHSVDSIKLATRLDRSAGINGRTLPVLLEFNVGGEESKYGYHASDTTQWTPLLSEIDQIVQLKHLEIRGLMTMPPLCDDAQRTRPYFRRLRELREFLAKNFPQCDWKELSMGTSTDFIEAVQEGATLVRVGSAILGARQ